jgi:hypothetical protein
LTADRTINDWDEVSGEKETMLLLKVETQGIHTRLLESHIDTYPGPLDALFFLKEIVKNVAERGSGVNWELQTHHFRMCTEYTKILGSSRSLCTDGPDGGRCLFLLVQYKQTYIF